MGKTDTIKDRRIDVYLDTIDRKERWSEIADDADESHSQFVQQYVKYTIKNGPNFTEPGEESKQIQELEEWVSELCEDVNQKELYTAIVTRPYASPTVTIEKSSTQDLAELVEKLEADEPLTWKEYHDLRGALIDDWDRFKTATQDIEIRAVAELEPDDQLSLGESLIFVARTNPEDETLLEAIENDRLHPTVIRDFSPNTRASQF